MLERPETEEVLQDIQKNSISLLALKVKIKNSRIFRINSDWMRKLRIAEQKVQNPSSSSDARLSGLANTREEVLERENEVKRVLLTKRIFKKFGLISEFMDKFSLFLDIDGSRLENCEKLFTKMEKFLISSKNPYFLTIPTIFMQSIRRTILSHKFRLPMINSKITVGDSDVLETLFCLIQNFSFLNPNFLDFGLNLIFLPRRSEPIFLDQRIYEIVSWVFEIRMKEANLQSFNPQGLITLLHTTHLLSRIINKTDQKHFLSKLFDVFMRMLIDNSQEDQTMKEIKFKGRTHNLPQESPIGSFSNFYDQGIIFANRNYLEAGSFGELELSLKSK
jgi:hypothetical protein